MHREQGDLISLPSFFQNKEIRLKIDLRERGWDDTDWIILAQDRD
jgi:hypothetical protein